MKNLVLLLAVFLTIGITTNVDAKNGFDKAISTCQKESPKKIQKALCNDEITATELYKTQYTNVENLIKTELEDILDSYKKNVIKTSKKEKKDAFEVNIKNSMIKSEVKKYLSLYRYNNLLETDTTKVNEIYKSITNEILLDYYAKNFKAGVSLALQAIADEKQQKYKKFIITTAIPKVDEGKTIEKMSSEYFKDEIESIMKTLKCMNDAYSVLKIFDTQIDELTIKNNSKKLYIKKLEELLVNIQGGSFKKDGITKILTKAIEEDIYNHIKESSKIK